MTRTEFETTFTDQKREALRMVYQGQADQTHKNTFLDIAERVYYPDGEVHQTLSDLTEAGHLLRNETHIVPTYRLSPAMYALHEQFRIEDNATLSDGMKDLITKWNRENPNSPV